MDFLLRVKEVFLNNSDRFLRGTLYTLLISFVGTIVGLALGMLIGVIRTTPESENKVQNFFLKVLKWISNIYVQVFRGTPMIVQSMLLYYGSKELLNLDFTPLSAAFIIVSINTGAYLSEVVRGGINSIDKGQFEAASALGMSHTQTMFNVVLPQAFKNIIPSIGNEFIVNIKDTSVLNVISVNELFTTTNAIVGATYKFTEPYLITSLIYLALTLSVAFLLGKLEKRITGPKSYELSGSDVMKSAN